MATNVRTEEDPFKNLYDDFVKTFSNILFAVLLFVGWGILTLIGVVVDQNKDAAQYFAAYPAPIARAILRLGFDNIYHSPWYVGIIGLILISLAVCTFVRVIPARLPRLHPVKIEKLPLNASVQVEGDATSVRARMDAYFSKRGWSVRNREFGGIEWSFADRHNWARRGVLIAHIGFVIIAAGTTIYWKLGFSGEVAVLDGQSVEVPRTHAILHLDNFAYRIQPIATKSGMVYQPIDYVSHVVVTGNDNVPKAETLRVNHPIDVDGTLYYQSSYGFGMRFLVTHNGKRVGALSDRTLAPGDQIDIPGAQETMQYAQFVPTVDRVSGAISPDPRVNDPAVVLSEMENGVAATSTLVPLHTWVDLGSGWRLVPDRYVMYSGFQYRHDPGMSLVGIGALVLLAGLIISFYFLPARLFVRVDPNSDGSSCSVGVAATTVKGYDIFETQFRELIANLARAEGKPA